MQSFIQRHASDVIGVLSGWDRLRLRGTLRFVANERGMMNFLWAIQVPLKRFKQYVLDTTKRIRQGTEQLAQKLGRPVQFLNSSKGSKEDIALEIAKRDGVQQGLICVLRCVEPCRSYEVGPNGKTKHLELRLGMRKCLHEYHYYLDPMFGFMHTRFQTWFPFTMLVCLNGREWLARLMDGAGIGYQRRDNCFVDLANVSRAQKLCDSQLRVNWEAVLATIARRTNPTHRHIFSQFPLHYYWSIEESEWATDIMFRSRDTLIRLYKPLIRFGIDTVSSRDVLRFLGKKVPIQGGVHGNFQGEVMTDVKVRPEGTRIRHSVNYNSIKMYDKQETVLRVETTINNARDMMAYRAKEGDAGGKKSWRYLRKGVADARRRAQISQAANNRYLEALSSVEHTEPLGEVAAKLCRPTQWQGQRVRALNPLSPEDAGLLETVNRGEFAINGFRNRDLRPLLFREPAATIEERRRQSAAVTRKLRLLRAHGLIKKIPKTHRYLLSANGRRAITALLTARQANTAKLAQVAA
jgi:hypothetical protein